MTKGFSFNSASGATANSALYLVRIYTHTTPFSTTSDLEDNRAQGHMKAAYEQVSENNIATRRPVENWLRQQAVKSGVLVERQNPIYFSLIDNLEEYKARLSPDEKAIGYALDDIDISGWSFVFEDSFISAPKEIDTDLRQDDGNSLRGKVLSGLQLLDYLENRTSNEPINFEAQMWDQAPKMLCFTTCPAENGFMPHQPV